MKTFQTFADNTSYPIQDFINWSDKEIQTTCTARSLAQLPLIATNYLQSKGKTFDSQFRSALLAVRDQRASGTVYSCGSYVSNGWRNEPVKFTAQVPATPEAPAKPATVTFPSVEGSETIKMAPIPVFPGERNRQGCEYIAPLIGALCTLREGKIVLSIELYHWVGSLRFAGMTAEGLLRMADVVNEVMAPGLALLPVTTRNSLVGPKWYQYVKDQLNICEYKDYLAIHTTFHTYLRKRGKEYDYLTARIPSEGAGPKLKEALKEFGKTGAYLVVAPFKMEHCPLLEFTEKKISKGKNTHMTRAIAATVELQTLLGEAGKSINLLTSTRGFSSMMSRTECDITFIVSIMLSALSKYRNVVVNVDSTSIIDPLHNSYLTWKKTVEAEHIYSLKFLVTQTDLPKIAPTYRAHCTLNRPDDHVFIWDQGAAISSKGEMKEKLKDATALLAHISQSSRYIVRTAVYGDLFSGVPSVKEKQSIRESKYTSKKEDDAKKGHYVYEFGMGHGFQGIISTEPELNLMAKSAGGSYYFKKLKLHKDEASWYTYVESSCNLVLCSPFRPQVFTSEICNVVTVDKTKFKVIRRPTGDDEFETLSGLSQINVMDDSEFQDTSQSDEEDEEEEGDDEDDDDDGEDKDEGGGDLTDQPVQSSQGDYFNDDPADGNDVDNVPVPTNMKIESAPRQEKVVKKTVTRSSNSSNSSNQKKPPAKTKNLKGGGPPEQSGYDKKVVVNLQSLEEDQ